MEAETYGWLAEYPSPECLVDAARRVGEEGYVRFDAFSPYPMDGLVETMGLRGAGIAPAVLAGGISGALVAYIMQYYLTVIDYPIDVGGRPLHSWPAFIPITFELSILGATLAGLVALLVLNRLPRLHHPLFEIEDFSRASIDGFFLCIEASDSKSSPGTRHLLEETGATRIWEVPRP